MARKTFSYDYFISYRRACGGALAVRFVKLILCKYGKRVFLDVDDIKKGEYEPQIFNAIENSKEFILILNEESWRENEKIDVYYKEIIKITEQSGDIIPIEFAKGVLDKIPYSKGCVLHNQLKRNIKKFEKVTYSHDPYFNFEGKLCDRLNIIYQPDITKLPKFSLSFKKINLVSRNEEVDSLCKKIIKSRIVSYVGDIMLIQLLVDRYEEQFNNIAYVKVDSNIKDDFVSQINMTLNLTFAPNESVNEKCKKIISYLEKNYIIGNNLLVLDVTFTNQTEIGDLVNMFNNSKALIFNKSRLSDWYIIICSQKNIGGLCPLVLNDKKDSTKKETTVSDSLMSIIDLKSFTQDERNLLRHFVLWKSVYIQYDIIEGLLKGLCENLEKTLLNLCDKYILSFDETKSAYKLHGLLADSLRKKIDVTKHNYEKYVENIREIITYDFHEFLPYADCIGNSLCEYVITTNVGFLNDTAIKFYETWKTDYAQKLYSKCINITNKRLETDPDNIDDLSVLSYAYNNLALLKKDQLNDYESAEKNFNDAIEIDERIIQISATPKYLNSLATVYNNYAILLVDHQNNDSGSAKDYLKKSINKLEKITETSDNAEYLYSLSRAYYNLALLQENSLRDTNPAEMYNNAIKKGEVIRKISNDPNPKYLDLLAKAYNNFANLQKKEDYESAIKSCKKAKMILNKIKDIDFEYLVDWINTNYILVYIYIATDKLSYRQKIMDEIKTEVENLLDEYPNYDYLQRVNRLITDTESKLNQ